MPQLGRFENSELNAESVNAIMELVQNPEKEDAKEILAAIRQLHQNPRHTMSEKMALAACNRFSLIPSVHLQNILLNAASDPCRPLVNESKEATKIQLILLELNDGVLRHAKAAGALPD